MLLHYLKNVVMLVLTQPAVLLRTFSLLRNQLPVYDLLHLLQVDVPDLVGPHAPSRDIAESRVVDFLLDLLLVVLRLLLLQLEGHVLVDD